MHEELLDFARQNGCDIKPTGKGKTKRIKFRGIDLGYVNPTVITRKACYGYKFRSDPEIAIGLVGKENDSVPVDERQESSERFRKYYSDPPGLDWHDGKGKNRSRTFLCLKEINSAKQVLLKDIQDIQRRKKRFEELQISLSIAYESWANETPFGILTGEECEKAVPTSRLTLFKNKAVAVLHKREMLYIAGTELNALCDHVIGLDRPAIQHSLHCLLTLKIESFLMIARSLLDVLSTVIGIHQLSDHNVQSFNDLRKRGDCPAWLKQYVQTEMVKSPDLPLREIGWLSFLLSEKGTEKCLRDFVTHRGVASYQYRELPFEEGWDLVFQPRQRDIYLVPIKDVVEKILTGVSALAVLVERAFTPKD